MNKAILILTSVFAFYVCNAHAKTIMLPAFDSIEIQAGKHTDYSIEIEQNDRLPPALVEADTEEKNTYAMHYNTLVIMPQKHGESNHFKIRVPDLKQLTAYGKGVIRARNLNVYSLSLDLNDNVRTFFSGKHIGLNHLDMYGNSELKIDHLKSSQLQIVLQDRAQATLLGEVKAQKISLFGYSKLKLYWLNSADLFVRMQDHSFAYLAGVARVLETRLKDQSYLFARYLRVKEGYIKTNQSANAEIWAQKNLDTRADGSSTIFHYRPADQVEAYDFRSGVTLDMNHLKPLLRDPALDWGQEYENSPRFVD